MKPDEYKYLADTLTGRRARDPAFESQMSTLPEGSINQKAAERQHQLDARTPEERELEQRQYSLQMFGKEHMRRYASPIISSKSLGELAVEGDQIMGSAPQQIKGHKGIEVEPWQNPDGSLRLQNHGACPQRQVLQIIRA